MFLWDAFCDFVGRVVDKISDFFGGSSSYSGNSVRQRVDVEQELAKFNEELASEASKLENKKINAVLEYFDSFIKELDKEYPTIATVMRQKKSNVCGPLRGIIESEVKKKASENNEDFRAVLAMEPGPDKKKAVRAEIDKILDEAEKKFDGKLASGIESLNYELQTRLKADLDAKEKALDKKEQDIKKLNKSAENGQIDVEKWRGEYIIAKESYLSLQEILENGARAV